MQRRRRRIGNAVIVLTAVLTAAMAAQPVGAPASASAPPAAAAASARPADASAARSITPGDVLVDGVASPDGFLLVASRPDGSMATLARLRVDGFETDNWVGEWCVTGSGRYVAAAFAPAEFANSAVLRDRGAFGAVVTIADGSVRMVHERVALKYHTPGCGPTDEISFLRSEGTDQSATTLLRVDARTAATTDTRVAGQITSPAPVGGRTYAVRDTAIVEVAADGSTPTRLGPAGHVPFSLLARADGSVDYLLQGDDGRVSARRLRGGRDQALADGATGSIHLRRAAGGSTLLAGRGIRTSSSDSPVVVAADGTADAVSFSGNSVVTAAKATDGVSMSVSTAGTTSTALLSAAAVAPASAALRNTTTPKCAVPRNDSSLLAMQPSPKQVEWAVDLAVRGQLTVSRPANWNKNGIGRSYTPQGEFPRIGLTGGGFVPAQVVLGVLAQESNLKEASKGALPGVPGNPLIADYYGTVYDANGLIIAMDYDSADCGYGIGQITDHMTATDTYYTADQKKMLATDYAANIAAVVRVLETKWNEAKAQSLTANDGNPANIEAWYFAIWGYNTGIYAPSGTNPYGVGWTNNPANSDYPPDRQGFLRATYEDAAHPGRWPYQEKVMGWAERPQLDVHGDAAYAFLANNAKVFLPMRTVNSVVVLDPYAFCSMSVNSCSSTATSGASNTWYCTRTDRKCWWHGPKAWIAGAGGHTEVRTYTGGAEPTIANPHPPSCSIAASSTATTPDLPGAASGASVVDDVATTASNMVGCPTMASAGSFAFTFGQTSDGQPLSKIDFHQIGAGYGGHFWYAHTTDPSRTANLVTGTWTPPSTSVGWTRIMVHVPDHGADTTQADYKIVTSAKTYHRTVDQRWNKNAWVDLGVFNLTAGSKVTMSNATGGDWKLPMEIDVAWDAVAFKAAAKPTVSYVAFGDSYSAGEGVEPYYPDADNGGSTKPHTDACHRSPQAYPVLAYNSLKSLLGGTTTFHFAACSGGRLPDVTGSNENWGERPQLSQGWLDENTTHVSISIGGNDAGFAAIVKGCLLTITACTSPTYKLTRDGTVDPEALITYEPKVIDGLAASYTDLITKIKAAAPNAKIVIVGYPDVVYNGPGGFGALCGLFDQATINFFDQMGARLANLERTIATANGARFANVQPVFDGHEACSPNGEWINATILSSNSGSGSNNPGSGSYHPKSVGHANEAPTIFNALKA